MGNVTEGGHLPTLRKNLRNEKVHPDVDFCTKIRNHRKALRKTQKATYCIPKYTLSVSPVF